MKTAPLLDPLRRFDLPPQIPLVHTKIAVRICGGLAVVATERLFRNREQSSIEATLTFPVPVHATLVRLTAQIGDRELVATALARDAARETYEDAIDRGKTTVLHEELLRGVHQLSVGHVPPGAELSIRSTWVDALSRNGEHAFLRIPTTVGEIYGRSPLACSDDLVHGPALHRADLSVSCDNGTVHLGNRVLTGESIQVTLDRPIDLRLTGWEPRTVQGAMAGGRLMDISVTPATCSTGPLDAVILVDCSSSMSEPCHFDAYRERLTKHEFLARGLKAAAKETLREDDRIQLWEFSSVPRKIGAASGNQFAKLIGKLTRPNGGTEIGHALTAAAHDSEARDFLLITDGKSYELDVQALAQTGKRFNVILIGEDSLEANVGHLAALTSGQIFVVSGAEAADTIQTAFAQLRSDGMASLTRSHKLLTFRGGMQIEVNDSAAPPSANDHDARLIGGFAAALMLPGMASTEAAQFAAANGIACHLTSLVLVDEAGATQNALPSTRKIPLSTPGMALLACPALPSGRAIDRQRSATSRSRTLSPRWIDELMAPPGPGSISSDHRGTASSPGSVSSELRRWADQINWEIDPEGLRRGDLSGLGDDLVRAIDLASQPDEVRELAAELGVPGQVVVLALLATALPKNRAASRFARAVLKGIAPVRIAEVSAALESLLGG